MSNMITSTTKPTSPPVEPRNTVSVTVKMDVPLNGTSVVRDATLDLETGVISGLFRGRKGWIHISATSGVLENKNE